MDHTLICDLCSQPFQRSRADICSASRHGTKHVFCSRDCYKLFQNKRVTTTCAWCESTVVRQRMEIRKSKSGRSFCNRSCAAKFNNRAKDHGCRVSQLEEYIAEHLDVDIPSLVVIRNDKTLIGSELDFYFPDLRLALEINGILHYEPIYGEDKFDRIQASDRQKVACCAQLGVELAVVDTSGCKRPKDHPRFYAIVKDLIVSVLGRQGKDPKIRSCLTPSDLAL